jgi:hypothetical protein
MNRVGDIFAAIDYMARLPFVGSERFGALGICTSRRHGRESCFNRSSHQGRWHGQPVNVGAGGAALTDAPVSATGVVAINRRIAERRRAREEQRIASTCIRQRLHEPKRTSIGLTDPMRSASGGAVSLMTTFPTARDLAARSAF